MENSPKFMSNYSVFVTHFFEYYFSTKCSNLDEFSGNRSVSYPGNLPIRVKYKFLLMTVLVWHELYTIFI